MLPARMCQYGASLWLLRCTGGCHLPERRATGHTVATGHGMQLTAPYVHVTHTAPMSSTCRSLDPSCSLIVRQEQPSHCRREPSSFAGLDRRPSCRSFCMSGRRTAHSGDQGDQRPIRMKSGRLLTLAHAFILFHHQQSTVGIFFSADSLVDLASNL